MPGFHGGDLPSRAALWHHNAFTPKDALAWGALPGKCSGPWVFAPSIAVLFRDAGFTPRAGVAVVAARHHRIAGREVA